MIFRVAGSSGALRPWKRAAAASPGATQRQAQRAASRHAPGNRRRTYSRARITPDKGSDRDQTYGQSGETPL